MSYGSQFYKENNLKGEELGRWLIEYVAPFNKKTVRVRHRTDILFYSEDYFWRPSKEDIYIGEYSSDYDNNGQIWHNITSERPLKPLRKTHDEEWTPRTTDPTFIGVLHNFCMIHHCLLRVNNQQYKIQRKMFNYCDIEVNGKWIPFSSLI